MRRILTAISLVTLIVLALGTMAPALAQTPEPPGPPKLTVYTSYPSQDIGIDETASISLKLRASGEPQIAQLEMKELPEGWTATFRGGTRDIHSVYVKTDSDTTVTLKLEPPKDVASGTYKFVVLARGEKARAELPIELTVKEKVPPRLSLKTDLPTIKGSPNTTFRYSATLKNEGDEDLTVNLTADAPTGFDVTIKASGKEVASLPLQAGRSKTLSIEAKPYMELPAGPYAFTVRADAGDVAASLDLTAEVAGQAKLTVTAPDGRLSGRAYAGKETPLKVVIRNTGTASARGVELSASPPSGWSVEFDPKRIDEVPAGQQVEVTAKIRPADKAVAGDYMVTIRAKPEEGPNKSAEFRITVLTSTLWGIVGVALIAVAVAVVALAVVRFGRR